MNNAMDLPTCSRPVRLWSDYFAYYIDGHTFSWWVFVTKSCETLPGTSVQELCHKQDQVHQGTDFRAKTIRSICLLAFCGDFFCFGRVIKAIGVYQGGQSARQRNIWTESMSKESIEPQLIPAVGQPVVSIGEIELRTNHIL
jgi:hypothetical protein